MITSTGINQLLSFLSSPLLASALLSSPLLDRINKIHRCLACRLFYLSEIVHSFIDSFFLPGTLLLVLIHCMLFHFSSSPNHITSNQIKSTPIETRTRQRNKKRAPSHPIESGYSLRQNKNKYCFLKYTHCLYRYPIYSYLYIFIYTT